MGWGEGECRVEAVWVGVCVWWRGVLWRLWREMVVYASQSLFFCLRERKSEGRNGGRVKERERDKEIILLWNPDSGAHRPRSQSIWLVWGGRAAGQGVLGGLIRRMLSDHPSRQAGENWLAPRRVEFMGGGGGGECGAVHWIPVTAFGLFQDLCSKLIKYLSCFPLPAVAAPPLAAPSPSLHWPFDPSDYCERWGAQAAEEWTRVSGRNGEELQTQDPAKRERASTSLTAGRQLHFRQTDKRLPCVSETVWSVLHGK